MKSYQAAALLVSARVFAAADFPAPGTTVTFYKDAGCDSSASSGAKIDILLPSSGDDCIGGTYSEGWPTVSKDPDLQIAYYNGDGLPESCNLAVLQQANIQPGNCGTAIDIINGGSTGSCVQGKLPIQGGFAICCGGSGKGCVSVPTPGKRAMLPAPRRPAEKDVTEVKRTPPFHRKAKRSCTFNKTNGPYTSRGAQQITSAQVSCPGGSGSAACSVQDSTSITHGSSNTFGVSNSVTTGEDLFATIQDTVTFSYSYTYSESQTQTQGYTVTIPAGESGYITWTPTTQCVDGTFSGDCSWSSSAGTACVPLYVSGSTGDLQGSFSFLQEQ